MKMNKNALRFASRFLLMIKESSGQGEIPDRR